MAVINGLSIKCLKQFRGHEGEPVFQGDLYLNGKKLGSWSQDSYGGPDNFMLDGGRKQVRVLDDIVKGMYPEKARSFGTEENPIVIKYGLESLIVDLLDLMHDEKTFKKAVKNGYDGTLVVTDGYHECCWQLPATYTALSDEVLLGKFGAALRNAKESFFPEDEFTKHQVKIYRSLKDFVVGEPIVLCGKVKSVESVIADAKYRSAKTESGNSKEQEISKD